MDSYIAELEATRHFKILNGLLQPDASATVADALEEIHDMTSAAILSNETKSLGNHPWDTWCALLEIVARTAPAQQSKLVDFVIQLQRKEVVDPVTGIVLKYHDLNVWTDLPSFGWAVEDGWNVNAWNPNLTSDERQRWENRNAFLAQLTAAAQVNYLHEGFGPLDFSFYALRGFLVAFEDEASVDVPADTAVRTACWWYIYAADRLWANAENGRSFQGQTGRGGEKYQNKPWTGYNRERWAIWEQGLQAAYATGIDMETKKLVKDALEHIKQAVVE